MPPFAPLLRFQSYVELAAVGIRKPHRSQGLAINLNQKEVNKSKCEKYFIPIHILGYA